MRVVVTRCRQLPPCAMCGSASLKWIRPQLRPPRPPNHIFRLRFDRILTRLGKNVTESMSVRIGCEGRRKWEEAGMHHAAIQTGPRPGQKKNPKLYLAPEGRVNPINRNSCTCPDKKERYVWVGSKIDHSSTRPQVSDGTS